MKGVVRNLGLVGLALAIGFAGVYFVQQPTVQAFAGGNCNIKGNVSINSGERIYHVPGQYYYDATKISFEYGERWFCSEADARAAGWRRAGY
jgi:hypothetical protein